MSDSARVAFKTPCQVQKIPIRIKGIGKQSDKMMKVGLFSMALRLALSIKVSATGAIIRKSSATKSMSVIVIWKFSPCRPCLSIL